MATKNSITEMVKDELISYTANIGAGITQDIIKWELQAFMDFSKLINENTLYFSSRERLKVRRLLTLVKGSMVRLKRKLGKFEITLPVDLLPGTLETPAKYCMKAYLRGAFICAGNAGINGGNYHLEIISSRENERFMKYSQIHQLPFRRYLRRGKYIYYINNIEDIISFFTQIEAIDTVLFIYDSLLRRKVRSQTQVLVNYDLANSRKQSIAAQKQLKKIDELTINQQLDKLPNSLYEIARMRLENPDYTLNDMAQELKISKSGVNNRLRRLFNWKFKQD